MTWNTQIQTDAWINIGGSEIPDRWIRLSRIVQVLGVKGAGNALVVTSDGERLASSCSVAALMEAVGKASNSTAGSGI